MVASLLESKCCRSRALEIKALLQCVVTTNESVYGACAVVLCVLKTAGLTVASH